MPPDPPGGRPAGPVVLRIKLRYDDAESMVQRFAPNVGKSGLFLPTKSLQPVGAEVKFELRLANDTPVLLGLGKVKATKEPDPANPKASFGMAIELMRVTRESRDLILRMLERRKLLGLPEVAIPTAADLDAARTTSVDTGVRAAPTRDSRPALDSGPIAAPVSTPASGPVAVPKDAVTRESEPVLPSGVVRDSAPVLRDSGPIARDSQPESLLTAPRRITGPLAVVKVSSVAPLAAEPARRKRPAIAEVIEAASGPIATTVVGLPDDVEVDLNAVIARARMLAGGDLDAELEALLEISAAPVEVGIEAASAELARQLGGVAVRRGQSGPAGWAPPPKVEEAKPEPVVEEKPPEPAVEAKQPGPIADVQPESVVDAKSPIAPEPADTYADPDAAAAALDDVQTPVTPHQMLTHPGEDEPAHEVEPDQIHDEIHQLGADDYEEVEHTHVGQVIPSGFENHAYATVPSAEQHAMAERLDRHLADVEAAHEDDDLGIREASGLHDLAAPEPVIELKSARLPKAEIYDDDGDDGLDDDELDDDDDEADEPAAPPPAAKPLPAEYQQDFIHRFDDQQPEPAHDPATVAAYDASAYQALVAHQEQTAYQEPVVDQDGYREQAAYDGGYPHDPAYQDYQQPADRGQTVDAYGHTVDAAIHGYAAPPAEENIDDVEEIDDFEILAEADEEDADLLSAHGEADASGQVAIPHELRAGSQHGSAPHERAGSQPIPVATPAHQSGRHIVPGRSSPHVVRRGSQHSQQQPIVQPEPPTPEPKPRDSDFAMRLDFGDDDELPYPQAPQAVPAPMTLEASAGHALAGFDNDEESQHNFTLAEQPSPNDFDESHFGFTPPGRFDQSDVVPIAPPPKVDWSEDSQNQWVQSSQPASDEVDLESALQALDVDLDDLAGPHASTEVPGRNAPRRAQIRPPSSTQLPEQRASSRGRAPRASTEDGVMIDFDDEDE